MDRNAVSSNRFSPPGRSRWERMAPALSLCVVVATMTACAQSVPATPQAASGEIQADHFVPSRPETVVWGWYPIDRTPVLTIQSGQTVRIDTLTHVGATQDQDPVENLSAIGVPREEMLEDMLDFWASRDGRPREGRSGHVITGPIYVEGRRTG